MIDFTKDTEKIMEALFEVGAHFGYSRSKRHPSMKKYVFGSKNNVEIIDLETTICSAAKAAEYIKTLSMSGKKVLFVGSKNEVRATIKENAEKIEMPYVINRWIGGTMTNYSEIKKRIALYKELLDKKEKGSLTMYTKKERLLIDRDIAKLEINFGGLTSMEKLPDAMLIIDPKAEEIAVSEAQALNIPIIAIANLDCATDKIAYTIPANDGSRATIQYLVSALSDAYRSKVSAEKLEPKK